MTDDFKYDVFLSHSSKDKTVVRAVAERLRSDGLRVWLDDWEIRPGDSIPAKIEEGLEHSRVLVLSMSANAFGSDWAQLEAGTFRFRDPLNKERRFIPLRLDDAPIKSSLAQFLYINWLPEDREQEYAKLLEACRPSVKPPTAEAQAAGELVAEKAIRLDSKGARIWAYAFSLDGTRALTGGDNTVRLWDLDTGRCLRVLEGHTGIVYEVEWDAYQRRALSSSADKTVRLWDVDTGRCLCVLEGHTHFVYGMAWSADQRRALSSSADKTVRLWDVDTGRCLRVLTGHMSQVGCVAWSADQRRVLSGSMDNTMRLWDVDTGRCLRVFEGHTEWVQSVTWSADQRRALSGSADNTMRLWEVDTGRCLRVLEGHTDQVRRVAWSADQRRVLSGSMDNTMRLWEVDTGYCLRVLKGHTGYVEGVVWSADQRRAFSGDEKGGVRVWDLSEFVTEARAPEAAAPALPPAPDQVQYTNAKVLLVGDTSSGKTGLSMRLALNDWKPSDSTVGAWATHWKLPVSSADGVEREIWLWDFGGQADQRLIHQLYMEDTALAVLVFDGQKEDLFETLGQWDRDLTRASRRAFTKLLAAGRVDAGGLRAASRGQVKAFSKERGFDGFLETSAKTGERCEELKQAILRGIHWENIPWRSSPRLFKRLKEEIVRLRDVGRVLMRFNELRDALHLRLAGEGAPFKDEELKAVVGLLAGPGVVWELSFGSWVLLQPERINAYAQAVIQTMRADEYERGCLPEERVLNGDLAYQSSMKRLEAEEERFVLLAMHQTLVERGLCLREHTDKGPLLIFPSYYRRERPELVGHPAVLVSYRFNGFLDDIYATLVVRLHHTKPFQQDQLWRYAADFKTLTGRQLGVKLTRRAEGAGELEVYFEPAIPVEEKIIFSRYVHEHLLQKGQDVMRLRHYVCPHCGTPVGNREVAMKRLEAWLEKKATDRAAGGGIKAGLGKAEIPTIICSECEKRVPLWDEMEQWFASPEMQQRVRELQEQSAIVLDNESKERALVGEVISAVALAGQICREFNVSDHGIDMEIEFKDDAGEATAKKLYLQLKSGDSYLRKRQRGEAEVFTIKDERHAHYWMAQAFPVLLVIRTSEGEVRWMEVRDWLKRASRSGKKPVKQIVFEGERFDVMSVRRWRDRVLLQGLP
jgi:small GTP-binding protein